MEHLFFSPTEQAMAIESNAAFLAEVHDRDWSASLASNQDLMPHIAPTTPWLGFDHQRERDKEWIPIQRDLNQYPVVRGWTILQAWDRGDLRKAHPSLRDPTLSPCDVGERVASMIQSWLYFGLIEAIVGDWVDVSYLARPDSSGRMLLYSRNLVYLMYAWLRRLQELTAESRAIALHNAHANLMTVATCIQKLLAWSDPGTAEEQWTRSNFPGYIERIYEVTPAVIRLTDAIGATRDRIAGESGIRVFAIAGLAEAYLDRNARLRARGWCPFLIACCLHDMNDSVIDWLDAAQRANPTGRHDECTHAACTANNVDVARYQMQHCTADCTCHPIRPNVDDVIRAIENDTIPTVRLTKTASGIKLQTEATCRADDEFVVFSHVWADGLGSTAEKGIYECQALRLAEIAEEAKPGCPWWIDSLMVPERSPYRYMAIRKLRDVYTNATKVVVIDKSLSQVRNDDTAEIVLWSIVSSSWAQRLWTFQESFLPTYIDILFKDGLRSFEPAALPRSLLPPVIQVVWRILYDRVGALRPNRAQQLTRRTNLGEILAAMNWRTTSRRSDETLAAAALLDFDPWSLPEDEQDSEGRMERLLLLVSDLPDDIIFFTCPKLRRKPFRWAPATLMARSPTMVDISHDHQRAKCTAEGLLTRQRFLEFADSQMGQDGLQYWFRDPETLEIYGVYWDPETKNNPGMFNAVVVRPIEDDQYVQPEMNQVVEGVALFLGAEGGDLGEDVSQAAYIGRVTIFQGDENDVPEGTAFIMTSWKTEMLCIT
ncbi:hypothetical protein A1O3_00713 [Capronia epimyces CBS 606.96]|uniref:Heterokaryon incompatibility domain-containing protein n=1 Tax=Capronia epimyces CBS 606.96 TaxID=1182542 RepID=W9YHX6_9EURO|nr:uncharacterized protein A1O3_00713 [Capronia epimyces CBS 606.96]EXJ92163.1 hypothetical protein A1O3_00713 [Capronia epimyces CBS 606.96]